MRKNKIPIQAAPADGDPAVYYRVVHRPPEPHGGQHVFRVEAAAHQLQPAAVHQEEVGAPALLHAADVRPPQHLGAAPGGDL